MPFVHLCVSCFLGSLLDSFQVLADTFYYQAQRDGFSSDSECTCHFSLCVRIDVKGERCGV